MRTVWKYPLAWTAEPQVVGMPPGSVVRRFAAQSGTPTVWAEVPVPEDAAQTETLEERTLLIVGTGSHIPDGFTAYLGTVDHNGYVFHLYERALV